VDSVARTRITIVLELDETTDGPAGCARLADGTVHEFHGWLALAAVIDSLARTPAGATPSDTSNGMETP
jgi:hypothetical protein